MTLLDIDPMAWRADAACRWAPTDLFFPEPDASGRITHLPELARALILCEDCPVRAACREWAIENYEVGVWGGTTDGDRRRIRADRHMPSTPPRPFPHGTVNGYRRGCRLDCCREASRAYRRQRKLEQGGEGREDWAS